MNSRNTFSRYLFSYPDAASPQILLPHETSAEQSGTASIIPQAGSLDSVRQSAKASRRRGLWFVARFKKDWVAFICTNPDLSEEEIIRIYGKRWKIEVFFKTCKSYLNLVGECHSLSYDSLTAHVAIVFARYMMIALEQ